MVFAELARVAEREHLLIAAAKGYRLDVSSLPDKLGAIQAATLALQGASVAHALIGGLAVGIRSGVPRATLDIDLAVTSDSDRSALEQILIAAGFQLVGTFPHSINFKHASGEPIPRDPAARLCATRPTLRYSKATSRKRAKAGKYPRRLFGQAASRAAIDGQRPSTLCSPSNTSYTQAMKTAISLPDELFRAVDAKARALKVSRSNLLAQAAREFIEKREPPSDATDAWNRALARATLPSDDRAAAAFQARSKRIARESWRKAR